LSTYSPRAYVAVVRCMKMTLALPVLTPGAFNTAHVPWQTIFGQTLLGDDRINGLRTSSLELLSVAMAITPDTPQPDVPIEYPFRFMFPSHGLLSRGGQGVVTSEVSVFRKLAAHNVLVDQWNTVGAALRKNRDPFPTMLIQKRVVQALSRFYKVWNAVVTPSIKPDVSPEFHCGPLSKCAERCVWALLHFAILGVGSSWRSHGSSADLQARLARAAMIENELKLVTSYPVIPTTITTFAKTLQRHARSLFVDTLVYKVSRFNGWFDLPLQLPEALKGQILVHAAGSTVVTTAISAPGSARLKRDCTAYMSETLSTLDPAYNLEQIYSGAEFPMPNGVAGGVDPLTIETIDFTTCPTEWGWWGEPTEL
jgi:hypothetical protein